MNFSISGLRSHLCVPRFSFFKKVIIISAVLLAIAGVVYSMIGARKRSWIAEEGIG